MGNLFTRAIKRFTQCRNQLPSHEQQESTNTASEQQAQRQQQDSRPVVQSIQVGQSIDSADYAALDLTKDSKDGQPTESGKSKVGEQRVRLTAAKATIEEEDEDKAEIEAGNAERENKIDKENEPVTNGNQDENAGKSDQGKPAVEEAVIKIQALVRGHLTRKALKDAQQQAATPAPNALGQSQFDEASLTKNPPSAVFSSPLSSLVNESLNDQLAGKPGGVPTGASRVPPLESIAEDVETSLSASMTTSSEQTQADSTRVALEKEAQDNQKRKLSPIGRSLAISTESRSDSISPAPSEANASIDLTCDTPASASIDILDHNIRPADPLASVLHHKSGPTVAAAVVRDESDPSMRSPRMVVDPPQQSAHSMTDEPNQASSLPDMPASTNMATIQNSHSIDSAEAAAIRIQSAFRGYHTRKHSPYRRRSPRMSGSPPLSLDSALSNGHAARRSPLRQQNATVVLDDLVLDDGLELAYGMGLNEAETSEEMDERLSRVQTSARRPSRQRQRVDADDSQLSQGASGADSQGAVLDSASTLDEASNTTCISMVALDSEGDVIGQSTNRAANLTRDDESQPINAPNNTNSRLQAATDRVQRSSIDQNLSMELDTESSNLGAALSLNEDLSEGEVQRPEQVEEQAYDGANLVSDDLAEAQRFVDQLVNEEEDKEPTHNQQEQELEKVTHDLEAALEVATEDTINAILDDEEQRTIEMESDDIERRDPSGQSSVERSKSLLIIAANQQPALTSGNSFEEEQEVAAPEHQEASSNRHLGIESPDEAIGSGRSTPALVSSHGGSSEEDEGEETGAKAAEGQASGGSGQSEQSGNAANKNKKKNRNRKKNRK